MDSFSAALWLLKRRLGLVNRLTVEQEYDVLAAAWRVVRVVSDLQGVALGIRLPAALKNLERVLKRVDPEAEELKQVRTQVPFGLAEKTDCCEANVVRVPDHDGWVCERCCRPVKINASGATFET